VGEGNSTGGGIETRNNYTILTLESGGRARSGHNKKVLVNRKQ